MIVLARIVAVLVLVFATAVFVLAGTVPPEQRPEVRGIEAFTAGVMVAVAAFLVAV